MGKTGGSFVCRCVCGRPARRENLLHANELVLVGAEADLLGMLDAALPVRVGVRDVELVVRVVLVELKDPAK